MEQKHDVGILAALAGALALFWQSLPALVKVYLLLATARLLMAVVLAIARKQYAKELLRYLIAHTLATCVILLIWFAGSYLSPQSEIEQVMLFSSKLIALWYSGYCVLEVLDGLAAIGVPVPAWIRERLDAVLRNGKREGGQQ